MVREDDDRGEPEDDQEQRPVVPEHRDRGDEHLAELDKADEQDLLDADPDVLDVGGHAADDAADAGLVEPPHRHPLDVREEGVAEVVDNFLAQLQRQPLAVVHDELRRQREQGEADRSPGDARDIAPVDRPVDDGGQGPGEGGKLDRAEEDRDEQPELAACGRGGCTRAAGQ